MPSPSARRWPFRLLAAVVFALVVFGLVSLEQSAQQKSRNDLATRFSVRGATAASFVQSYTGFVLGRETTLAEQSLSGPVVSDGAFRDFLQDFDFGPAVLLDSAGNALDVAPAAPSLIGTQIGSKYKHLSSALRGTAAVSNIVPSVAQRVPIVAFAAPFNTRYGRRVVSGAFDLVTQPMGLYMHHVLPYVDSAVYLVDATGKIIVGSTKATGSLAQVDPALSRSLAHGDSGIYKPKSGVPTQFAVAPVTGTPWRLVLVVSRSTLFLPISASSRVLPWAFLSAFALAAGALLVLFVRNREARAFAARDARTDPLTGIANRRAIQESLARLIRDRRRHDPELGVLMIDVDHFKAVNDSYGHDGGDIVLRDVVKRIAACLRTEDQVGRWGGEEFIVLLPATDIAGTMVVAERIRAAVAGGAITLKKGSAEVTVSIGGAVTTSTHDVDTVVTDADIALYRAKQEGRDRWVVPTDASRTILGMPIRSN